ncbi:class I SAM-dependent methyltransferase [Rheinheimera pleomorphica]|uniref:class I SAM-dependent methyltransferase n=1 Tax=Rheinheimera pleomorphica TaxID=2703963 RepID=UPI001422BB52|nr:class I SAM-dependent methyltransferase [Rheinheimera pleomorphica]
MPNSSCPLCDAKQVNFFQQDVRRSYYQCQQCMLVFADRASLLSATEELTQYQLHQNDVQDLGYRRFLQRLAGPLLANLPSAKLSGLDFGCGPGPLLAQMLAEAGHDMAVWDPYFAAEPAVLQHQYDFISCSEAIEHFANPRQEWALWLQLLKPGATLAIMTKRYTSADAFANWHYKLDPTHISFFAAQTFAYLAERDGFDLQLVSDDVVLLKQIKH